MAGEPIVKRLELLLLSDFNTRTAATITDHLNSFEAFSRHHFRRLSMLGELSPWVDLARFDGVVIHYTLVACSDHFIAPATRARLRAFTGLKAMFIQDEYRFVDKTVAAIRDLGINLLFTCVPEPEIDKVYSPEALPGVTKVNVLTGYVPENLLGRAVPAPSEDRSTSVTAAGSCRPISAAWDRRNRRSPIAPSPTRRNTIS